MMIHSCPGCGSSPCEVLYEVRSVPKNSRWLSPSREEAVALPRGDIALEFCRGCGLVFNAAFDPGLVDLADLHEEIDAGSPSLKVFHRLERYSRSSRDVLEIDCEGEQAPSEFVHSSNLLQDVAEPDRFLRLLKRVLRKDARLFVQVPNFTRTLRNAAFWEIHYPNRSYFSPGTLYRLLRVQGFAVRDVWMDCHAEHLMADAHPANYDFADADAGEKTETIADLAALVARFAQECREKQAMWCEILRQLAGDGHRVAIWGSGSRAASFLTTLAVGNEVSYVLDMNPGRQGKYTAGTGHRIVGPDVVAAARLDVVIVMNATLTSEIRDLLARAGCTPAILIA